MTPNPGDESFLFPYLEGHYGCICSRCLSPITSTEMAFRILRLDSPMAFEEYRYCEACQRQAGFPPQRSTDKVLEQLTAQIREHPRFRATKREIYNLIRSIKVTRENLAKAKDRQSQPDPWEDLGELSILAAACRQKRSSSV